jgi:hypothetical protein
MAEIQFFGEVDIHPTKKIIASEYPAWYFDRPFEQLGEEVARLERALESDGVPKDKIGEFKDQLREKKARYERIAESIPKISGEEKDRLSRVRKEMGKIIQSGYYKRSDMMKGTVDAHREAERMVKPMVEIKPEFMELVKAARVPIVDGKCSRDGLVKAWKITGKLLNKHGGDEDTNAETLRRD